MAKDTPLFDRCRRENRYFEDPRHLFDPRPIEDKEYLNDDPEEDLKTFRNQAARVRSDDSHD